MTPEELKAYKREWYYKNKERLAETKKSYSKARYENNREKILEYQKAYQQTPSGRKAVVIANWKQYGLIHDDYSSLYDSYLQATHCDVCKSEFKSSFDRKMDHDHETGLFRQFLCAACNGFDRWLRHIPSEC